MESHGNKTMLMRSICGVGGYYSDGDQVSIPSLRARRARQSTEGLRFAMDCRVAHWAVFDSALRLLAMTVCSSSHRSARVNSALAVISERFIRLARHSAPYRPSHDTGFPTCSYALMNAFPLASTAQPAFRRYAERCGYWTSRRPVAGCRPTASLQRLVRRSFSTSQAIAEQQARSSGRAADCAGCASMMPLRRRTSTSSPPLRMSDRSPFPPPPPRAKLGPIQGEEISWTS